MSKERLEEIKELLAIVLEDSVGNEKVVLKREDLVEVEDLIIQQAEQLQELEQELKTTIKKKNRYLRDKDKRIKHLEWDNMIHRNAHSRLYASMYSLREELKEKNIKVDWVN